MSPSSPLALVSLITVVIAGGFSHSVSRVLIRPATPPPAILYVHVALAVAWLACLLVQSSLVVARRRALHRRLGIAFAVLGAAMSVVAFFTAIALRRLDTEGDSIANLAYLSVPLGAWLLFTAPFALALLWRRDPGRHRPLMLIAACSVTGPALARFPEIRHAGLYLTVLIPIGLMAAAMAHERLRSGRWSAVYGLGILLTVAVGGVIFYLNAARPAAWIATVRWLLATF